MRNIGYIPAAAAALAIAAGATMTTAAAGDDRASEVLAATRKAIGNKKLDTLKTFSVEARVQRNLPNFQVSSNVEMLLELPDKYVRSEAMSGGPMNVTSVSGFNGDTALVRANAPGMPGGGMVIRMGPGGNMPLPAGEKPTPEQQEQMNAMALRTARQDLSRLMLGWFGMAHPSLNVEYVYAGDAESPDGKAYVIDATNGDGFAARLFIDQETNLPLMLTYEGPQMRMMTSTRGGGPGAPSQRGREVTEQDRERMREELEKLRSQPPAMVEYRLYFDDWREVDGIRFPHTIRRATAGNTEEEWTVSRVKVNPKIDSRKFDVEG